MHISYLLIDGFRLFGHAEKRFELPLNKGLTALIGENDQGKSAVVDALRFVLGTRDQNFFRIDDDDFHRWTENEGTVESPKLVVRSVDEIWIQCQFSNLSRENMSAFAEYLTYEADASVSLYVNWIGRRQVGVRSRKWAEVCSGKAKEGSSIDMKLREVLKSTYLRPLRDAEREMSAGKNSRLSQILLAMGDINNATNPEGKTLLAVGDDAFVKIADHPSLSTTTESMNSMLGDLSFESDKLIAALSINQYIDPSSRLKQLLEKLELDLKELNSGFSDNRGLGSNNLLFMGCEMLLLETADEEVPIMLIEEPEAHLHPQRQLLVIDYLQKQAASEDVQIIVTTHSNQLASTIRLENLVLIKDRKAFPMGEMYTALDKSDYRFLERFLDVTKANLFFSKSVLIVEGDAENILLPVVAKLLGRDFVKYGVSIVNVGHTGLGRFARILMRSEDKDEIDIPVACLTDLDVLPLCAPEILGLDITANKRKWKYEGDFNGNGLVERRLELENRVTGQNVKSYISELWTFEFDLANNGLLSEVWLAAKLAKEDSTLKALNVSILEVRSELREINKTQLTEVEKSVHCYSRFTSSSTDFAPGTTKVSKSIAAQYLSEILIRRYSNDPAGLAAKLPQYIVAAIDYVTGKPDD